MSSPISHHRKSCDPKGRDSLNLFTVIKMNLTEEDEEKSGELEMPPPCDSDRETSSVDEKEGNG